MFFSVITKNLNWEILTKNLVTFKRWNCLKDGWLIPQCTLWMDSSSSIVKTQLND